jgi:hypothetical protein
MPAIATVALGKLVQRTGASRRSWLAPLVVALVAAVSLGQTALTTAQDYFEVWGSHPEVRFQYSAAYAEIAAALNTPTGATPVAVSGYFIEDADPVIFEQIFNRPDVPVRWFDARDALLAAALTHSERVAIPAYTPLAEELRTRFLQEVEPLAWSKEFKLYPLDVEQFRAQLAAWPPCVDCPVRFNDQIDLTGVEQPDRISRAAGVLPVLTAWQVVRESQPGSSAIFIHVLDDRDQIVAQDDRLGVPRHTWQPGDEFVQVHRLNVANVPPGKYRLALGLYDRVDNARWAAADRSGRALGDRIILGEIEVTP